MLISELAERAGVAAHTIRYYEKEGLLGDEYTRRAANNYRHYSEEALTRLTLIRHGQAAGFTLAEIRTLMTVWDSGELTVADKEAIIRQKVAALEQKITELEAMKAYLLAKLPLMHIEDTGVLAQFDRDSDRVALRRDGAKIVTIKP